MRTAVEMQATSPATVWMKELPRWVRRSGGASPVVCGRSGGRFTWRGGCSRISWVSVGRGELGRSGEEGGACMRDVGGMFYCTRAACSTTVLWEGWCEPRLLYSADRGYVSTGDTPGRRSQGCALGQRLTHGSPYVLPLFSARAGVIFGSDGQRQGRVELRRGTRRIQRCVWGDFSSERGDMVLLHVLRGGGDCRVRAGGCAGAAPLRGSFLCA